MKVLIILLLLFLSILQAKELILVNRTTLLPATTKVIFDNNKFSWSPSCFDAGLYRVEFFTKSETGKIHSEIVEITVNDVCEGTLKEFCDLWLKPTVNFKHYANWANKRK